MTLRIFLNALKGEPYETNPLNGAETVRDWLRAHVKGFDESRKAPFEAFQGGEPLGFDDPIRKGVPVDLVLQPRGTDPFSITAALFKGAQAAFRALMPTIPGTPNTPAGGKNLSTSNVRGNRVKLGDTIREIGGHMRIYPDYLVPSRSYFKDKYEQWVETLFCIGVGEFEFAAGGIKVGETSLLALDTAASVQIYQPGQSNAGDSRADWWHSAEEVGASSTGTAGLELTVSAAVTQGVTAGSIQFSGFTVTIPTGQGKFPTDWAIGQVIRIVAPYSYTVTDGGGTARDIITGALGMVAAAPGDDIEVVGVNSGTYDVVTFNVSTGMTLNFAWGDPANNLALGTGQAAIGPAGLKYRITNVDTANRQFIQVERLTTAGTTDSAWPGFNSLTTSSATITLPADAFTGGYRGPFPAVPQTETCTAFEVDVFYPNGLCGIGREGQIYQLNGYYDIEWRDMAVGGAWNVVHITHTGNTRDQQGFTDRIDLPYAMRPEVRVKKVFVNQGGNSSSEYQDDAQWFNLRGRIDRVPRAYQGVTTLAVALRSSDRIATQAESLISVEVTRKLPYRLDGQWQPAAATRDITAFAAYLVKSLGYTDSQIDLAEMDNLQGLWSQRGDTFDAEIADTATAKTRLLDVFGAGMGEFTMDRGRIRPVRDGVRSVLEGGYSPQSHIRGVTQSVQFPGPDDYDGVEVTYTSEKTWQEETVSYTLPGDLGVHVEKITVLGVTSRTRAWRIAARARRSHAFRRRTFKWSNEFDGRVNRYLAYVLLSDDVPGFGQSALLEGAAVNAGVTTLYVTEKFTWEPAGDVVALRRPDGTMWGPFAATRVGDYALSVDAVIDFTPIFDGSIEPPHVMFGHLLKFAYPVLLTAVKPNGMSSTDMEAVGYDARVYTEDDNTPP